MRLALLLMTLLACAAGEAQPGARPATRPSFRIGTIEHPAIKESSGVIESRGQPGVLWTLNDSGNPATLYAIDRNGKLLGEWDVDAKNQDWEDIAIDNDGHLYIADIGNNGRKRTELPIYQIDEPGIHTAATKKLPVRRTWRLHYPAEPFDAEGFFVHRGKGYVVSKLFDGSAARLYSFDMAGDGEARTLKEVASLPVRIPVTGADISIDGKWLAIVTPAGPTVCEVNGDLTKLPNVPSHAVLYLNPAMEAICFVNDGVLATTEAREVLLFTWEQLKSPTVLSEKKQPQIHADERR